MLDKMVFFHIEILFENSINIISLLSKCILFMYVCYFVLKVATAATIHKKNSLKRIVNWGINPAIQMMNSCSNNVCIHVYVDI